MAELTQIPMQPTSVAHLPTGHAERRALACRDRLDVGFDLESPGFVILVAATGAWDEAGQVLPRPLDDSPAPHKLELIPPGDGSAVAEQSSERPESNLVYEVPKDGFTPGRWTARVTNLGTGTEDFGLYVSFPTVRELQFADLSTDLFAQLARLRIEFQRGDRASRLEVQTPDGPVTHFFTVSPIEYWCPWMPRVMAYLQNVESTSIAVSVPSDTTDPVIRCELGFEDEGLELTGTIPLNLRNMRLTLDLPIVIRYHRLGRSKVPSSLDYDEADVRVSFSFDPEFEGLVEWLPGFFPMWRRSIQRAVEGACRGLLATPELKKLFSTAMEARVLAQLGPDTKPVGVSAADGKLRFSYYTV